MITSADKTNYTFRQYRKTGTTSLSDEILPTGTRVATLEGEYVCQEPSRLAVDAAGNVYPSPNPCGSSPTSSLRTRHERRHRHPPAVRVPGRRLRDDGRIVGSEEITGGCGDGTSRTSPSGIRAAPDG